MNAEDKDQNKDSCEPENDTVLLRVRSCDFVDRIAVKQ